MNHNTKSNYNQEVESNGYTIINDVFSNEETQSFIYEIEQISNSLNNNFRKSKDLFAIRQFLKEVPTINKILFNDALKNILGQLLGNDYFVVKSIYFDKPEQSNWFVSYHQDLTISVDKKLECSGFNNWTIKQNQFSVQPTEKILENIFTIRIHLDDTDEKNGALRIIPKSHANGIVRLDSFDFNEAEEQIAKVKKGGIMIMKPLLFHASNKTINNEKRRVIHVEFSNLDLPEGISWSEKINI